MLDQYYGFDIMTKTRKQKYVYGRKVLFKLANELGFGPSAIARILYTSPSPRDQKGSRMPATA